MYAGKERGRELNITNECQVSITSREISLKLPWPSNPDKYLHTNHSNLAGFQPHQADKGGEVVLCKVAAMDHRVTMEVSNGCSFVQRIG